MKCLILAAGYATRLYPLTENFPKPLLRVGEKAILDYLVDDLRSADEIDEFVVISNHRYARCFQEWADKRPGRISVLDDGTESNETRLGAVRDIRFAMDALGLDGDLMVVAGDNLLDFSLAGFVRYARAKKTTCVLRYYEPFVGNLKKSGVLWIGENDRVLRMEEKPAEPGSHWCCPPFYYFAGADARRIAEGIEDGCGTDAPGSFIAWLCARAPVHAMEMPGRRFDIGDLRSYERAQREYRGVLRADDGNAQGMRREKDKC